MDAAFEYVKENGGIDTEEGYEYDAMDEQCHFHPNNVGATVSGFVDITENDEEALKSAIATQVDNNLFKCTMCNIIYNEHYLYNYCLK